MNPKINKEIADHLIGYLVDIASGNFSLSEDEILKIEDEGLQEVLFGLRHLADDLEYEKSENEKSLDQIKERTKEIKQKNMELKRFSYSLSHELKSPLRSINYLLAFIKDDFSEVEFELPEQIKNYINQIEQTTSNMEDLIKSVLEFNLVNNKQNQSTIDLNILFNGLVTSRFVTKEMTLEIEDGLPTIWFNSIEIKQVIKAIISNAFIYNTSEKPKLKIFGSKEEDNYLLHFKDNGTGIDPKHHERVFQLFETLQNKAGEKSSGLGLSIVKRILVENNCSIKLVSQLGNGADFIISFPADKLVKTE